MGKVVLVLSVVIVFVTAVVKSNQPAHGQQESTELVRAQKKSDDISVVVNIAQRTLAGKAIELTIEVENIGKDVISFDDDLSRTLGMELKDTDGKAASKTILGAKFDQWSKRSMQGPGRRVLILLQPGKKAKVAFNLALLFDVSYGGNYLLTVASKYDRKGSKTQLVTVENVAFSVTGVSLPVFIESNKWEAKKGTS